VWVEKKRFNSFAPPRQNSTAKWCAHNIKCYSSYITVIHTRKYTEIHFFT
jgi:hypothetical protein